MQPLQYSVNSVAITSPNNIIDGAWFTSISTDIPKIYPSTQPTEQPSNNMLMRILTHSPDGIIVIKQGGDVMFANPAAERLLGITLQDIATLNLESQIADFEKGQIEIISHDNILRTIELKASWIDWEGKSAYIVNLRDITERVPTKHNLQQTNVAHKNILCSLGEAVYAVDLAGRFTFLNAIGEKILGWQEAEVLGQCAHELIHYKGQCNQEKDHSVFTKNDGCLCKIDIDKEHQIITYNDSYFKTRSGVKFPVATTVTPIVVQNRVVGSTVVFKDLTEQKQKEEQMHHLAYHDALTGLANRSLLHQHLAHELAHAKRYGQHVAILFLDLNRFKHINDTFGHALGDELLRGVAARLCSVVRESDLVARLGGDEFVILLSNCLEHCNGNNYSDAVKAHNCRQAANAVEQKIMQIFNKPFMLLGHEIYAHTSIGISLYPDDANSAEKLLNQADSAMYQAKRKHKADYTDFADFTALQSICA